jgi:RHH-type transcriptional regulator, proline utilization regulon repressor / proline dehydrogenase / delta 1-pyrroline-5-carboxylate dehydrogenase
VSTPRERDAVLPDLESRTIQTGLRLYDLIEGQTPSVFQKDFWTGKILDWSMRDEAFKVEMFRFVDVFPYLSSAEAVARHLREYFCRPGQDFPEALQWGIKSVSPDSFAARLIAKGIAKNIQGMGGQFIAGADAKEALPELKKLRRQGLAFTISLLGEAVVSEAEAEDYSRRYRELMESLYAAQQDWPALSGDSNRQHAGELDWGCAPKINLSIKPTAMNSQMSARAFEYSVAMAKERLRPLFRRAMELGAFINLDIEHRAVKNLSLALYRSLMEEPEFRGYPHSGLALQAYLRDSADDLEGLIAWSRRQGQRVTVRLVKGAYWDAEQIWALQKNWPVPVFTNKHETDANFEKLARVILQNHDTLTLACASHNIRSIASVWETARELGVPEDHLEFQVLYGMAEPVRAALQKAGLRLRLYTPVGEMIPGMAYLVRRLLENTSNESFLRQSFAQKVSREELLRNPAALLSQNGAGAQATPDAPAQENRFRNEPYFDWTLPEEREGFSHALQTVRSRFPVRVPLLIGGREETTGKQTRSTNPNDPEEIVGAVSVAGQPEAAKAVAAARKAFAGWRDTPPKKRAEYLFRAAEIARERRRELAAVQVFETGKTWGEADADVCEAIDFLEYYGREMIRLGRPRRMGHVPGEHSEMFYEPRGVACVIAPWNFPLAISTGMTSAALVTGNTVVYKPSSESPVIGHQMVELFRAAGLPDGVLNFLPGPGGALGDYLVTHPDVAMIAFTGSKEVGLRIIRLAGETPEGAMGIKRVVAELGGKNAILVDSDADLDEAVAEILHSAFGYQGQKCSACSRLIVLEEIYSQLIERLVPAADSLHLGPAEDPRSYMGAVISASARQKIESYIDVGKKEGRLLLEKRPEDAKGHFAPLTIFEGIGPGDRLAQEEIFGPVLAIVKVKDFDEALEVANGTAYALTGGVFSRSPENIEKAKRVFRVGNLYINRGCTGAIVERHPFGGFKMSGVGSKAGGPDYLQQFLVPRNIVENTMRRGFAPVEE